MGPTSRSEFAVRFFLTAVVWLAVAAGLSWLLSRLFSGFGLSSESRFPPVFAVSTACLLFLSWSMTQAEYHVRRERQPSFRRSLNRAFAAGTVFLAVQSYALSAFFPQIAGVNSGRGALEFIAVAVSLHGLHAFVAWLFLLYVLLQARADRYDHEYSLGVTFCAWFWHALGIVWLAVLCVMAIANYGVMDDGITPEPVSAAAIFPTVGFASRSVFTLRCGLG